MMFLLKYWKFITPAIAAIFLAGAFFYHGHSQYQKGYKDAKAANVAAKSSAQTDNATIWKDVRHEIGQIVDLDSAAADLGIMRPDELR